MIEARENLVDMDSLVFNHLSHSEHFFLFQQVTMARREDAEEAVRDPNPTIDGRRANVNLAYMGAKNRTATLPRK